MASAVGEAVRGLPLRHDDVSAVSREWIPGAVMMLIFLASLHDGCARGHYLDGWGRGTLYGLSVDGDVLSEDMRAASPLCDDPTRLAWEATGICHELLRGVTGFACESSARL